MLDPATAGMIVVVLLAIMLTVGVHIGVALGLGGFIGMFLVIGPDAALSQMATIPFSTTNSFTLAVIPLFILMGSLATQAGLTTDLYRAAFNWLGGFRGGLAMATTLASAAFGAASGSTLVNAAVFTKLAMPEMVRCTCASNGTVDTAPVATSTRRMRPPCGTISAPPSRVHV